MLYHNNKKRKARRLSERQGDCRPVQVERGENIKVNFLAKMVVAGD